MSDKEKEVKNKGSGTDISASGDAKLPNEQDTKLNNILKNRLKKYIKKLDDTGTSITKQESETIEVETFKELYQPKLDNDESYKSIPKFYYKLPRNDDVLAQKLREETRAQFLQKKSKELLDNAELKHLWTLLEKTNGNYSSSNNDELIIDYFQFKKIREEAGPKYRPPYFTAEVFGRLQAAEGSVGRIRAVSLFNYVMRRVWLQQTRIGLSLYDVTGQGYLTEQADGQLGREWLQFIMDSSNISATTPPSTTNC